MLVPHLLKIYFGLGWPSSVLEIVSVTNIEKTILLFSFFSYKYLFSLSLSCFKIYLSVFFENVYPSLLLILQLYFFQNVYPSLLLILQLYFFQNVYPSLLLNLQLYFLKTFIPAYFWIYNYIFWKRLSQLTFEFTIIFFF